VFAGNWLVGATRSLTLVGLIVGVTLTLLTVVSGAAFLQLKGRAQLPDSVTTYGTAATAGYLLAVVATLGVLGIRLPDGLSALLSPAIVALVMLSIGLAVGYTVALQREQSLRALGAAAAMTYGLVAVVARLMYPAIDPATGTTVRGAIVSTLPLNLMTIGASLLLPLVAVYFVVLYSAFSGPITPEEAY
jgi:cytochrome d ubiquinol oxidase subunit II